MQPIATVRKQNHNLQLWRDFLAEPVLHSNQPVIKQPINNKSADLSQTTTMNVSTVVPVTTSPVRPVSEPNDIRTYEQRAKDILGFHEVTKISILVPLFSEALGTCLLVFIGCTSCVEWVAGKPSSVSQIAFTFGLTVAALAHVLGPVSGCHINPAVTVGMVISGNCSVLKAICFIVCQCLGGIGGSALLRVVSTPALTRNGSGETRVTEGLEPNQAVILEAIISFVLVLVVHAVTDSRRKDVIGWAPLAIGLTITGAHLAAVPVTGSSMNPARSLGPAVILGFWTNQWVYWTGPMAGGLAAGAIYRMGLRAKNKDDDEASYDF